MKVSPIISVVLVQFRSSCPVSKPLDLHRICLLSAVGLAADGLDTTQKSCLWVMFVHVVMLVNIMSFHSNEIAASNVS